MNKEKRIQELRKSIKEKFSQLEKLEVHVDKSTVCSDLYNKVVLEKAILNKELQDLENNGLMQVFKSLIPRKRTLICDYFRK